MRELYTKNSSLTNSCRSLLLLTSVVSLVLLASAQAGSKGNLGNPQVAPPQSNAYGKSYGEWYNEFQKWLAGVPTEMDPIADTTGAFAGVGQSGHVFFLPSTYLGQSVKRTITVPAGTALFFVPAFEVSASSLRDPSWDPATMLATALTDLQAITDMTCSIDGRTVQNVQSYTLGSPDCFYVTVQNGSLWGSDAVGQQAVGIGAGNCLMIAPLPVGTHTIYATGTFPDWGTYEVLDTIIVTAGRK